MQGQPARGDPIAHRFYAPAPHWSRWDSTPRNTRGSQYVDPGHESYTANAFPNGLWEPDWVIKRRAANRQRVSRAQNVAHYPGLTGGEGRHPSSSQPTCVVREFGETCGRPALAKGLCHMHYRRWSRHGTATPGSRFDRWEAPLCTQPGCYNFAKARGCCSSHYEQKQLKGETR